MRKLAALLSALPVCPTAVAAPLEFRGNLRTILAFDTRSNDPYERLGAFETRLFAEARIPFERWSVTGSALSRYSAQWPRGTHQDFEFRLYEGYARYARGPFAFEGGPRVIRWGVMEYVSPADAINPRDFRRLLDPEVEDTYLAAPLVRVIFDRHPWTAEAVYQPFFVASKFDMVGTDAAVLRPSLAGHFGIPYADVLSATGGKNNERLIQELAPGPGHNPLEGEGGIRIGRRWQRLDLALLYLTKRETVPALDLPLQAAPPPPGAGSYPRNNLAGATLRSVLDSGVTFKGEALVRQKASFYASDLRLRRETGLTWTVGADYDRNARHFFTLEYAQDRVVSGGRLDYFLREKVQHILSGAAALNFDARTWTVELKGTAVANQGAYLLHPRVLYRPTPPWEIGLGANFWGGPSDSLFGLLSGNDQIYVSGKYLF